MSFRSRGVKLLLGAAPVRPSWLEYTTPAAEEGRDEPLGGLRNIKKRAIDVSKQIQLKLDLDKKRIVNQQSLDEILAESNQIAQKIGLMAKENKFQNVTKLKSRASDIKTESKKLKPNLVGLALVTME